MPAARFETLVRGLDPLGRTIAKTLTGQTDNIRGGATHAPCQISLTLAERPREVPSGNMTVRVENFQSDRDTLSKLVADNKAQVLASAGNQFTDGTWAGAFRIGVRAADMDAVVQKLASLGRVESRRMNGIGLGDLSRVDPEALGIIELTLSERATLSPGPERAADSLRGRLRDGLAGLYASLGWIAYGMIVLGPWLILAALLGWLLLILNRRRRAATAAAQPAA